MDTIKAFFDQNVNQQLVVSTVVGMAAFGAVIFIANKSGVNVLKKGATVAKGGK